MATQMIFLRGPHVYLRPLTREDAAGPYPGWLNDPEVNAGNSHAVYPYTVIDAVRYIESVSGSRNEIVVAIALNETDAHIGNITLQQINWVNRTAELAILVGERTAWGKGYGLEAAQLIVRHAFVALNLHRIGCATFRTNEAMKRIAARLGMRTEGVRKGAAFKAGRYIDIVEFGLLRHEFIDQVDIQRGESRDVRTAV